MNGIIIYKSKYGTTKKYAEWLSEETGFECIDASKVKIADLNDYDTIVFGGSVYASKILIADFAEKCMKTIFDKKVIMFCVGSLMQSSENTKKLKETLNKEEFQNVPLFYCRGAINVNKMGFFDFKTKFFSHFTNNCIWSINYFSCGNFSGNFRI